MLIFLLLLTLLVFSLPLWLWAYSTLSAYLGTTFNYNVNGTQVSTGLNFPPTNANNTLAFKTSYGLGSGAGLAQIAVSLIQAITASGNATVNLQSLVDVLGLTVSSMTAL